MGNGTLAMVDNDPLVLQLLGIRLRQLLPGWTVLWTAARGEDVLVRWKVDGRRPDVLLVDMSMESMSGPALCREVRLRGEKPAILAMTAFSIGRYAADAARAGAQGIVAKHDTVRLAEAIRGVAGGGRWSDDGAGEDASARFDTAHDAYLRIQGERPTGVAALNDTERRLVDLCARGYTSDRIARETGRGVSTVNTHLERAVRKSGAGNRLELVTMWLRERMG
ncbi:DNA-binding response regulator [Bifidobacterium avesanii]|nr:DNA-binding response regulator [Bifidobacterium avesanii]